MKKPTGWAARGGKITIRAWLAMCRRIFIHFRLSAIRIGARRFRRAARSAILRSNGGKVRALPHCAFNRTLTHTRCENGIWHLDFAEGPSETADIVVSAMGGLHVPQTPEFKGKNKFKGPSFHTAHWNHDIDLTNKRVAIIGSAASAVQVVPQIIDNVAHLDVYQRTPNWVLPRMNKKYPAWRKWLHRNLPFTSLAIRALLYLRGELLFFPAFFADSFMQRKLRKQALDHLEELVPDEDLRAKLTPDFQIGCKRILMIDGYFEALQRTHAELITDGIAEITETGIVTQDGADHDADVIIYATGFKPFDFLTKFGVTGPGGRDLAESWPAASPRTVRWRLPVFRIFHLRGSQ